MSILDDKIKNAKTIAILGHMNADGDCMGSELSVYNYILNKFPDKKPKVYVLNPSKRFSYLSGFDKISDASNDAEIYDLTIVCDVANLKRIEKDFHEYLLSAKDVLVIDHHESNTFTYESMVIEKDAAATCEVLYKLMDKNYIDKKIAECLYTGLATDTGVFRYSCTSSETMNIAGALMDKGIDFTTILDKAIFNSSLNQRKAEAIAFNNARYLCKGRVIFSYVPREDVERLNLHKNDLDNIIVYLREIENIDIAVFCYSVGYNIYKLSLRSNSDNFNVSNYAMNHDGGGHARAAGCTIKADIDEVIEIVNKELMEFLETNDK